MKALDVGCPAPSCFARPGKRCIPPSIADLHGANADSSLYRKDGTRHDTVPGKPDEWKNYHKERSAKAAEMTRADGVFNDANLFVNVRETWLIQELLERRAKQGAKSLPRGEAKRIQSLLAKIRAVFPVKG